MTTYLKKILQDDLFPAEVELLTGSYDSVGDIALVRLDDALYHRFSLIGEAILKTNRKLKTVARRVGRHSGEFRTTEFEIIAGEKRTETEVREFGLRYYLDVATCYFSVRSGSERKRVASFVQKGERVLVLFSGIAPFPLMLAKYSEAEVVVGVEKNREAHLFALKNCAANKLTGRVRLYCADAAALPQESLFQQGFHRLLMPLPVGGELFLSSALSVLLPGGVLHLYKMAKADEVEICLRKLEKQIALYGRKAERVSAVKAGHCGNKLFRYVFEVKII